MNFQEKVLIVVSNGFSPEDTEAWDLKYQRHRASATTRGLKTELTFDQYLSKVATAGLVEVDSIGKYKGQFQLARIGDIGNYT